MKVLSQKIGRPRLSPFRGKTHLECGSLRMEDMKLRGNPASIEMRAEFEGREFIVRIDPIETARLVDVLKPLVAPVPAVLVPGATND